MINYQIPSFFGWTKCLPKINMFLLILTHQRRNSGTELTLIHTCSDFFPYILPGKGLREFKKCHIFVYKWQFTIIGYINVQWGRGHYEVAFQFWSTFFKDSLVMKQFFLQNFNLWIVLFYCSRRDYRTIGEFYIASCMSNSAANFRACAYFVWLCASFSKPMILWESYWFLLLKIILFVQ